MLIKRLRTYSKYLPLVASLAINGWSVETQMDCIFPFSSKGMSLLILRLTSVISFIFCKFFKGIPLDPPLARIRTAIFGYLIALR